MTYTVHFIYICYFFICDNPFRLQAGSLPCAYATGQAQHIEKGVVAKQLYIKAD